MEVDMKRLTPALALAMATALLIPAATTAKGVSAAKVCGADECVRISDDELALTLGGGGPTATPPEHASGWYRTTLTVAVRDPHNPDPRDRERAVDRFSIAAVPSQRLVRGEGGHWTAMDGHAAAAYAELTAGITPRPARTLPGVGADAPQPVARVDEVVEPPPAESSGSGSGVWIAVLGGALLAGVAVVALVARHRRAGTRRAGPEASGEGLA
jgi:hypothetical protein